MTDPTPERWQRVRDVFDAVADLPMEHRATALDAACSGPDGGLDTDLRAEVAAMLAADGNTSVLDADALDAAALVEDVPSAAGERFGAWRVVREIGRGGMGAVYLVERADGAYRQQAALKRLSAASPAGVRRFERERQILAELEHPGIARLLDGGVADGVPYLVMEYVEGASITEHAERQRLGLGDRIRLFADVCEAVGHAHRHLVVHRDLKPSNVLVADDGDVKLLDFGIAKLLDDEAEDAHTRTAVPILTPEYAAPEQVTGAPITTATDVYSLGVVLYELLAGKRPYEVDSGTLEGVVEAIRDTRPTRPSLAAPEERRRALRGDLDTVVMKALAKEPARRYASASDLADDLRRYLDGLPVEARAPTAAYRMRRFAGRHKAGTALSLLVVLAVLAGVASTLWQAREARAEAATSAATARFLAGLFEGADPTAAPSDSLSALDLLDRGARRLDGSLSDQPAVRADLYLVVGDAYLGLGRSDSAVAFARRALSVLAPTGAAPDDVDAVRARVLLGRALFPTDPGAAATALAAAVDAARKTGDDAILLDALEAQGRLLGAQALTPTETVAVLEEAIALARVVEGEESPRVGRLYVDLSSRMASVHQHGRVEELLREALGRLPASEAPYDRSVVLLDLGKQLHAMGRVEEAQELINESVEIRQRLLGPEDVRTAEALAARAGVEMGGPVASERDAREALRLAERAGDSTIVIHALDGLSHSLALQERHDEAVEVLQRRLATIREVYGTEGTRYPAASGTVARALHQAGRYDEAAAAWETSIRLVTQAYGPESAVAASTLLQAGATAEAAGRRPQAEEFYERAVDASRSLPPTSRTRALAPLALGRLRLDRGRAAEAIPSLRQAADARETLNRPSLGEAGEGDVAVALLGEALAEVGDVEAGHQLLAAAVEALTTARGADHEDTARARDALRRARQSLATTSPNA